MRHRLVCNGIALVLICAAAYGAEVADRAELGRSVKLTILVDKVMQPTAGWTTEEWMIEAAAAAGFNVFSPRAGHARLDEVGRVNDWCAKYGIFHMPWMRGTLAAPAGSAAAGRRVVWASGTEQLLWSPNSDEFWQWTEKYIVAYAKMSKENPHIMGVFLDYENYARGSEGNLYSLSYDDAILARFAAAEQIDLPKLPPAARKGWLDEHNLHESFRAFQIKHWRERCRHLRAAVDAHDPTFRFCIYPAPGTPFMVEAAYTEWATAAAPLILADATTYGRPSRFVPQAEALEQNRQKLVENMNVPQRAGIPFIYAGGIDPVVRGADPEFSGKNAVMISELTGGYWIFYEGPTYEKGHPEYWQWFTWANRAIADGRFAVWHEPRRAPDDWSLEVFHDQQKGLQVVAAASTGGRVAYPLCEMRGENLMIVAGRAGQAAEITLENRRLGKYQSPLVWELRDAQGGSVAAGKIPHLQSGTVRFTPKADGLYLLGASAGPCAYAVIRSNVPVGLYAVRGLGLVHGARRLYFHVPADIDQFTISAKGVGGETVRVNVYDPAGTQVATGQTGIKTNQIRLQVAVAGHAGQTWSLQTTKADAGALEDNVLTLDPKLPPTLSLAPEHVFQRP